MRVVAVGAIARRAWVLNFCLLNLFGLLGMTGDAQRLSVWLRQYNLAVLGRGMAGVTLSAGKGRMRELRH